MGCTMIFKSHPSPLRPATERRIAPENHAPARVLLIGLDGTRPDAIVEAHTPHLDHVMQNGAFTLHASTQCDARTKSGPGWSTILTGVNPAKHRVAANQDYAQSQLRTYPTVLWRAKHTGKLKTAMSVHWDDLANHIIEPDAIDARTVGNDDVVTTAAETYVRDGDFSLIFVHLEDIDSAGHDEGFTPKTPAYRAAIETTDARIGRILAALSQRPTRATEHWTVIITTDHGGTRFGHGARIAACRRIFVFAMGDSVIPGELQRPVNQADITPTILDLLGVHDARVTDGVIL